MKHILFIEIFHVHLEIGSEYQMGPCIQKNNGNQQDLTYAPVLLEHEYLPS